MFAVEFRKSSRKVSHGDGGNSESAIESGQAGKAAGACVMVLYGAAGDLTKRKLIPALFNLVKANLLPRDFAVLGVSVDDLTLEQFCTQVTGFLPAGGRGA